MDSNKFHIILSIDIKGRQGQTGPAGKPGVQGGQVSGVSCIEVLSRLCL